jgi:sugar lactone lactonase YvrE
MKKLTLPVLLLALSLTAGAQNIKTLAGNGTSGFSGDGGAATAAELGSNYGIALDAAGNLYIADQQNNEIRKISTTGVITSVVGNGRVPGFSGDGAAATAAEIFNPTGVCFDASGNMYIADAGNNRVRMVNTSGIISTVAGNGTAGSSGDLGAATNAELNNPTGVWVSSGGQIFIADEKNNKIRAVVSGTIVTAVGTGAAGFSGDGGAATAAELDYPYSLCQDASGNLYIADEYNDKIRMVNTSGNISTVAGNGTPGYNGDGGNATAAELWYPYDVKFDASGNMYIADEFNERIRLVNTSGKISTVAGDGSFGFSGDGGPATAAELNSPVGVAISAAGNIYISDNGNLRIRETYSTAGVNNITNNTGMRIYPNPSNGQFNLVITNYQLGAKYNVSVFNMIGEMVYSNQASIQNSTMSVDMNGQPNGVYIVRLQAEDGTSVVHKLEIVK